MRPRSLVPEPAIEPAEPVREGRKCGRSNGSNGFIETLH